MTDCEEDVVDVVVRRRSTRKKRRHWRQELDLSVRTSRSSGLSETIPVNSRGGQPAHKRRARKLPEDNDHDQPEQNTRRQPFCGECGHKFIETTHKFCTECGTKREFNSSTQRASSAAESMAVEMEPSTCAAAETAETASCSSNIQHSVHQRQRDPHSPSQCESAAASDASAGENNTTPEITCAPAETMAKAPVEAVLANKRPKYLRCGWRIIQGKFVSPDGKRFACRKEASRYHNKNIPKLEPQRKDNWQVYVDSSATHMQWIAPDKTVYKSYVTASRYAEQSGLTIYGKDGISVPISRFFNSAKTGQSRKSSVSDLPCPRLTPTNKHQEKQRQPVQHQPAQQKKQRQPVQHQPVQQRPKKQKKTARTTRVFTVPKQTQAGCELQLLLRHAGVYRLKSNRAKSMPNLRKCMTEYNSPRQIGDRMIRRVCFACTANVTCTRGCVCTNVYSHADRTSRGQTNLHLWHYGGFQYTSVAN